MGVKDAEEIAANADLPDRVDDIAVARTGTHIFGRSLCSLTHFCVPTGGKTHRGWGWKLDDSLPLHPDLPNREVSVDTSKWEESISRVVLDYRRHPVYLLLNVHGYTPYFDEITYPTAAIMAAWVGTTKAKSNPAAIGATIHFAQDCCVRHHVKGWLLNGHSEYEGRIEEWWHFNRASTAVRRMLISAARTKVGAPPREVCEKVAHLTLVYCNGTLPNEERRAHRYAIQATARILRWWEAR
jgi:hypothetical protein